MGARGVRPARRCSRDRLGHSRATDVGQTGDHRDRHRHHSGGQGVEHPDSAGARQGEHAHRPGRRRGGAPRGVAPPPRRARPWGAHVTVTPATSASPTRSMRPVRSTPRPRGVSRGLGNRGRRHGYGWVHPVHRRVRRGLPAGQDPGDRRRGSGTQAHSVNESLHLGVFERAAVTEALLLAKLGAGMTDRVELTFRSLGRRTRSPAPSTLLEAEGTRILLDCGLFRG